MKKIKTRDLTGETKLYLNKYIKSLNLKKSNKLPSEEVLSDLIGVSRITIRSALNELASEGIIFRKHGKGTFVNLEALEMKVKFNTVLEFKKMIIDSGFSPSVKLLGTENIESNEILENKLGLSEKKDIVLAKKVFYADHNPCAFCIDYIEKDIIGDTVNEDLAEYENSIFEYVFNKTGKSVQWDKVEILTTNNIESPFLNEIFDLENKVKSFLLLEGINFDNDNKPLVYAEEYIDTDFIKFNMIRQRIINY